MADVFDDEVDAEPTISIRDYLKAVEEEESVRVFFPLENQVLLLSKC